MLTWSPPLGTQLRVRRTLAYAVLYAVAVQVGRASRLEDSQLALVWPAAALGLLWLAGSWGRRRGLAVDVGVLFTVTVLGNVWTGASVTLAGVFGVANTLQALVACWVFQRWRPGRRWQLRTPRDLGVLVVSSLSGSTVSALVGPVAIASSNEQGWASVAGPWVVRNAVGTFVVAAVGLRLAERGGRPAALSGPRLLELVGLSAAVLAAYQVVFEVPGAGSLTFVVVPLSVWLGLRFSTGLVAGHVAASGTVVVGLTWLGHGPFAAAAPAPRVLLAQGFVGVTGLVALVLAVHRDERQALVERLAARNAEVERYAQVQRDFVAAASHELRTPLTSISGYLELLGESPRLPRDSEEQQWLSVVRRGAQRLETLVGDLLLVNQMDTDKLVLRLAPVDVADLLHQVVEAFAPAAAARHLDVQVQVEAGCPPLLADRDRVEQVLGNLLGNAVKFSLPGGAVRLRARPRAPHVLLEVSDTGLGIAVEEQPYVFDRFFRSTCSTKMAVQGTGLGLPVARSLARAQRGDLTLQSTPGVGSTFTVTLPAARAAAVVPAQAGPPGPASPPAVFTSRSEMSKQRP